jgi:hypothetical protein
MKEYCVQVPICGYAVVMIEAEDEKEAIKNAIENVELSDMESWEALEHVVEGNCFYGPLNDIEVEEA